MRGKRENSLSKEDLRQRAKVTRTVIEALDEHGCLAGMPENEPIKSLLKLN